MEVSCRRGLILLEKRRYRGSKHRAKTSRIDGSSIGKAEGKWQWRSESKAEMRNRTKLVECSPQKLY